jgi:hypothetical protein
MPKFTKSVCIEEYTNVDIDVSVEDFYDEMSNDEAKKMLQLLIENGYSVPTPASINNWEFTDAITKLSNNYYQLTNEEEALIIALSKRF